MTNLQEHQPSNPPVAAEAPAAAEPFRPFIVDHPVLGKIALSHTPSGEVNATVDLGYRYEVIPVSSERFFNFVARSYYEVAGEVPKNSVLKQTIRDLGFKGLFDGPQVPVFNRYAKVGNTIYIDLCDREGHYVEISPEGWSVRRHSLHSLPFLREPGMKPQALPEKGGSIGELATFLNLREESQFVLIVAFILGAMYPDGPFPMLTLHGPQGASKSTTLRMIRSLVDPSEAALTTEPNSERDLFISASRSWLQCIDNVSTLSDKMSDAYCRLVTEGVYRTRKLFSNREEIIIRVKRPAAFNGIAPFARQNDFLDRSIWVDLPSVPAERRRPENQIWGEFEAVKPRILGALYDAISAALRNLDSVKLESPPRMADFAHWIAAAEPACPWEEGAFIEAYQNNRAEMVDMAIEGDSLGSAVWETHAGH